MFVASCECYSLPGEVRSHKAEDERAAKIIKDKLEPYGGDRLSSTFQKRSRRERIGANGFPLAEGCRKMLETIDNIQREADARRETEIQGSSEGDRLRWAFDTDGDRMSVDENLSHQMQEKNNLRSAAADLNLAAARKSLEHLRELNGQLVVDVCNRYKSLLERDILIQREEGEERPPGTTESARPPGASPEAPAEDSV